MKRKLTVMAGVAVLLIAAGFIYFSSSRPLSGRVDAGKILAAARTYSHDLQAQGKSVPLSVDLRDLVAKGLLSAADVASFAGMVVTISLTPKDDTHPQEVLMSVRLKDGSELVALEDGSVHRVTR